MKVLKATRCALIVADQLFQGTLTLNTRNLRFQASSLPTRLNLYLDYIEVVAVIPQPHYGSKALHLATQTRILKFVNMPERDETMEVLLEQWMAYCRMYLLDGHPARGGAAIWREKSRSRRITFQEPDDVIALPCGCSEHYATIMAQKTLPGTPLSLVNIIFGDGLSPSEGSYSTKFFDAWEGVKVSDAKWETDAKGEKHRTLLITMSDPNDTTKRIRYFIEQRLVRETADVYVIEGLLRPEEQSHGHHRLRARWCFTRSRRGDETTVVITAELESANGEEPMDTTAISWVMKAAIGGFSDLLDSLYDRLNSEEAEANVKEKTLLGKLLQFITEVWLFAVLPFINRYRPRDFNCRRYVIFVFSLLIIFLAVRYYRAAACSANPPHHIISEKRVDEEMDMSKADIERLRGRVRALEERLKSIL